MKKASLLLAAAIASFSAHAAEPLSFKGFTLGTPKDAVVSSLPGAECKEHHCKWPPFSYGGVDVHGVSLDFDDGKFSAAFAVYDTLYFEDLLGAMTEKFGKPSVQAGERRFHNRAVRWIRKEGVLVLIERHPDLHEGYISLSSPAAEAAAKRREQERAKSKAKDL
jgi:hypothetical protein